MGKATWWVDDATAENTLWLGEIRLFPVRVSGGKKRDIDQKKGKGKRGAKADTTGSDPAELTVELMVGAQEGERGRQSYEDWQRALPQLDPTLPSAVTTPWVIQHPLAAELSVTEVLIESIDAQPAAVNTGRPWSIKLVEHIAEPKDSKSSKDARGKGQAGKTEAEKTSDVDAATANVLAAQADKDSAEEALLEADENGTPEELAQAERDFDEAKAALDDAEKERDAAREADGVPDTEANLF